MGAGSAYKFYKISGEIVLAAPRDPSQAEK